MASLLSSSSTRQDAAQVQLLEDFNATMEELLENLVAVFPDCNETRIVAQEYAMIAPAGTFLPAVREAALEKFVSEFYEVVRPFASRIRANDVSVLEDASQQISFLQQINNMMIKEVEELAHSPALIITL